MRSRTELVTTTFDDSQTDQTESEDSEEDWRPVGRKKSGGRKRRNKRKGSSSTKLSLKRKKIKDEEGVGEDSEEYEKSFIITLPSSQGEQKPLARKMPPEKNFPDRSGMFTLYLYKKDLDKDYRTNSHLCLWRRDGSSLLQKYIRVKTNNCEEFIFTSSSVYSSWDEKRRKEFAIVSVKCLEDNNRRVIITDLPEFHSIANAAIERKLKIEQNPNEHPPDDDEEYSNDKFESQEDDDEEEYEEEISEDDEQDQDINSVGSSEGEEEEETHEQDDAGEDGEDELEDDEYEEENDEEAISPNIGETAQCQ